MNQRKSSGPISGKLAGAVLLVFALAVGAIYWFAIRDDEETSKAPDTKTTATVQTFKDANIPFSFQFPATFARSAGEGFVWIAGISPVDILDIRQIDAKEISARSLPRVMSARLKAQDGISIVGSGNDTVGGVEVATFTVDSGSKPALRSKLVYFSAGGATWQFECQSQEANRAAIEVACAQALATFKFS